MSQTRTVQLGDLPTAMQEYLRELNTKPEVVQVCEGGKLVAAIETGRYFASLKTYDALSHQKCELESVWVEDDEEDEEEEEEEPLHDQ